MRRPLFVLMVVGIAFGLAATVFWSVYGDTRDFALTPRSAALFAALVALSSANLTIRWLRWRFLVRRFVRTLPARTSLVLYFGTLPAIATPLYLGELVRTALAARGSPRARHMVVGVWAAERVADATALLAFLLAARGSWLLLAAVVAAWLALSALRSRDAEHSLSRLLEPRVLAVLAVTSAAAWALPILGLWMLVEGLGASLGLGGAAEAFSVGTFLGALSLIPLGSGVTGSSVIVYLGRLGVPPEVGLFAGAMLRAGTTWYAFGLGLLLLWVWRREILSFAPTRAQTHFDELADSYEGQIPAHVRERLVDRKLDAMERWLRRAGLGVGARGLDVGCGHGWYASEMARRGFVMSAFDASPQQVAHIGGGAGHPLAAFVARADALPHRDGSFDFAYAINVFHHITEHEARARGLREVARVLKPGGLFFLHEINTENPIFEFYMGYVFPLLREIDDGTEAWLKPDALPPVAGARWSEDKRYLTFLPDFLPAPLLTALGPLERRLEASRFREWSAHYMATLIKRDGHPRGASG